MDDTSPSIVDKLNILLLAVKHSKNDSEKCAALLVISKLVRANELSEQQRRDLFFAIGFSFPLRLLSSEGDSDCPREVLVGLGLTLLSSFVCDLELANAFENRKVVPVIVGLIQENCENDFTRLCDSSLADSLQYLAMVSATDKGCQWIIKSDGLKQLVRTFCMKSSFEHKEMFWSIVNELIKFDADKIWFDNSNREHMLFLLEHLCEQVISDFSEKKFEVYNEISSLIQLLPSEYADSYYNHNWILYLKKSLFDVLRSKVTSKQRNPTLHLCHKLSDAFGLKWTRKDEVLNKSGKAFSVLLLKLVCVEIRITIYEWTKHKDTPQSIRNSSSMAIYLSCCALFEAACASIASFDEGNSSEEVFTFENIEDLHGSLSETIESICDNLLPIITDTSELTDLVVSCLRTVGSWLNVQLFASSKIGLGLVKQLFSAFKIGLQCDPSSAVQTTSPALLHYAENPQARDLLLELDILPCLTTVVTNPDLDCEVKTLSAQCLMAFCLEAEDLERFDELLPIVMDYSIEQEKDVVLCFYIYTLAVMLWNKVCRLPGRYPQRQRFFHKVTTFLHSVHSTNGHRLKVAKQFSSVWDQVEQLWPILMKELIRAARNNSDVCNYVLKSPLPAKVDCLLASKSIASDVSECYHLFGSFVEASCIS